MQPLKEMSMACEIRLRGHLFDIKALNLWVSLEMEDEKSLW
jgi:hypothetical protein